MNDVALYSSHYASKSKSSRGKIEKKRTNSNNNIKAKQVYKSQSKNIGSSPSKTIDTRKSSHSLANATVIHKFIHLSKISQMGLLNNNVNAEVTSDIVDQEDIPIFDAVNVEDSEIQTIMRNVSQKYHREISERVLEDIINNYEGG